MSIALSADKALIVGDFNIHFENTQDPLKIAFEALLFVIGFTVDVIGRPRCCDDT